MMTIWQNVFKSATRVPSREGRSGTALENYDDAGDDDCDEDDDDNDDEERGRLPQRGEEAEQPRGRIS